MVRIKVLWYNGNADSSLPKRNRNNVMEGYMTTQIFKEANNLAFVFIILTFLNNHFFFHKGRVDRKALGRTKLQRNRTYLKFFRNASGDCPVCFLKNRIK